MECPHIDKKIEKDRFNHPIKYKDPDSGIDYIYWLHVGSPERSSIVQFCKQKKGMKKNPFECMNEDEWRKCIHFN